MTWSEAQGRDRETFVDLEAKAEVLAPQIAAEVKALLLKAYQLGDEDTRHAFQVIWDKAGRVIACDCRECREHAPAAG